MITQSESITNDNRLFHGGAGNAPQIVSYGGMIGRVIETDHAANMVKVSFGYMTLWLDVSMVESAK